MRLVLQRVSRASVTIGGGEARAIGPGLVALLGIRDGDDEGTAHFLAGKMANLRIFSDQNDNLNLSLLDTGGELLLVSNFTLYANCRKGRRPSFDGAAGAGVSQPLYQYFVGEAEKLLPGKVKTGEFGAKMQVEIHNDGPITILLDSDEMRAI